jgi:repressor LexA
VNRLTEKQELVLDFIHQYLVQCHRSPFIREIQEGCRIASYKSVVDRLNALEHKGYIKRTPNKHRSIRLSSKGHTWKAQAASPPEVAASQPGVAPDTASLTAPVEVPPSPVIAARPLPGAMDPQTPTVA